MPVLRDWKCGECGYQFESMEDMPLCPFPIPACPSDECHCVESCGALADRVPVATKTYKIRGDNSASVTPKKHRSSENSS
jgi:hypothetical protein